MSVRSTPFDCVENAQIYIRLLIEASTEAKQEIEADVATACGTNSERLLQALRLVRYKLYLLEQHLKISGLVLDDLRRLRRLLLENEPNVSLDPEPAFDRWEGGRE